MSKRFSKSRRRSSADASSNGTIPLPFASTTCEASAPTTSPPSMSSTGGALARTLRSAASALVSTVHEAVCGASKRASSVNFARVSTYGRTSPVQERLFDRETTGASSTNPPSAPFSETMPLAGTMLSGSLFEVPSWARLIDESESSSSDGGARWPTPTASDSKRIIFKYKNVVATRGHHTANMLLAELVAYLMGPENSASLSPDFAEALMGFPSGWTRSGGPPVPTKRPMRGNRRASRPKRTSNRTDCAPSETPSYPPTGTSSGTSSRGRCG